MSTSKKDTVHFLGKALTPHRIERLLVDWVNIPEDGTPFVDSAIDRLTRLHPEVVAGFEKLGQAHVDVSVLQVADLLKAAWNASDRRHREWYIFKARDLYRYNRETIMELMDRREKTGKVAGTKEQRLSEQAPPAYTLFEQIMFHFQVISERAKRCANPECIAPYFLAKKKAQRYCGSKCAGPALREQKRRWWNENRGSGTE